MQPSYRPFLLPITCLALALVPWLATSQTAAKIKVTKEADLPRFSYPVQGSAQDLLNSPPDVFLAFITPVVADTDRVLRDYDIQDHSILRDLLQTRLNFDILTGKNDAEAQQRIAEIRSYEDKPASKLLSNLVEEQYLKARAAQQPSSPSSCPSGYESLYRSATMALPWSLVRQDEKSERGFVDFVSPSVFAGIAEDQYGATISRQHALTRGAAAGLLQFRAMQQILLACKQPTLAVLTAYIHQNDLNKPNIWQAREAVLPPAAELHPVNVAIWDSGFDTSLFPGRVFTDPNPGRFDPNGIAFDVQGHLTHGPFIPLTPQQTRDYPTQIKDGEALNDIQSGIDSEAATALKKKLAAMPPAEVKAYFEETESIGSYAHGTHVAGIAANGNPAIRLAYARMTYDTNHPHLPPTETLANDTASSYTDVVSWFKARNIRVVNMSWWDAPANYEKDLADNGLGKDPADRKQIARHLFEIERAGLYNAIKSAPGILFVTIAGNSNSDNAVEETIPSSFELPNLIVAGAVDSAGDETDFTSYGKNVAVHADGYQVESFAPGGARIHMSGTSMAAPQVTNLAAKLLAIDPSLTPAQLITLIVSAADTTPDGRRHLINPRQSVALLNARKATPSVAATTGSSH